MLKFLPAFTLLAGLALAQRPPLPAPMAIPKPGPTTDSAYAPGSILPGGIVIPIYPAGAPSLKAEKIREAEVYNMSQTVPGRIASIVNIHNPSIEVHLVDRSINTGSVVILAAGGGHNTLNVGTEAADFVPFFYNYGVNTVILRNRLRRDGYNPQTDAVNDALQSIRVVRAYAKEFNFDPARIGIIGFSAGAELCSPSAVLFEDFDKRNAEPSDPFAGVYSRPTSLELSTRDQRRSPATALLLRFHATLHRHSWPAVAPAIAGTPFGRWTTTPRSSPSVCRTSRCIYTATDAIRVTRYRMVPARAVA